MTAEGWKEAALKAVREHDAGDSFSLELLGQLLAEQDFAKERLRRLGFGVIGTPWPKVIDEVAEVAADDCR